MAEDVMNESSRASDVHHRPDLHGYPSGYTEAQWAADNGVSPPNPGDAVREAAPDLLAACKMALAHMWGEEIDAPTAYQLEKALTDAIAQAEGGGRS